MLSILKDMNDAKLLEKYIRARFGDIRIVEVEPSDAVRNGPYMMLFGDTEDWAQIMATDTGDIPLPDWLERFGKKEGFWHALVHHIDQTNLNENQIYKKAGITRSVFSDLRCGKNPSRNTALKLCIALKLDLKQTADLLRLAGYTLSRSKKDELIIMYSILRKDYSLNSINERLFEGGCNIIK